MLLEDLEAGHAGHADVQEGHVVEVARELARRGVSVLDGGDLVAEALEDLLQHEADRSLVVSDEDAHDIRGLGHRRGSGVARGGRDSIGVRGRSTAARVPSPSTESTRRRPPWRRIQ